MTRPDLDAPNLPLSALMQHWPEVLPVFLAHQMRCAGCYICPFHTVGDACAAYGLDEAKFRRALQTAARTSTRTR